MPAALRQLPAAVSVLVEGTVPGVAARAERVVGLLGFDATVTDAAPAWWGVEPAGTVLFKVTHELAALDRLLAGLARTPDAAYRGSVGVGVGYVALAPSGAPGAAELLHGVSVVRAAAHSAGGTAVLLEADLSAAADDLASLDRWGPVPAQKLRRAVKDRFDPKRLLAPGRFVGGI